MNKAIFIDLDGTLLNDNYQISHFDLKALRKIGQANYKVYLITGKSIHHAIKFYNLLQLKTWLITSAGQVISKGDQVVWQKILDYTVVIKLLNEQKNKDIILDFIIQTKNTIYASNLNSSIIKLFYEQGVKIKQYRADDLIDNPVGLYLNLKINSRLNRWKLMQEFNDKWKKWFNFHPWEMMSNIFIVHVVPTEISKWSAIEIIKKWDDLQYIVAVGNGRNDIPILKNSDLSIAMKNATNEVKFFANQVTEFDNNNSGVGKTLLSLLNISL